jgi:hypothetical protein
MSNTSTQPARIGSIDTSGVPLDWAINDAFGSTLKGEALPGLKAAPEGCH